MMNQYTIGAVSGEFPDIGMVDSPDMESYISLGVFEDITDDIKDWDELDQFRTDLFQAVWMQMVNTTDFQTIQTV